MLNQFSQSTSAYSALAALVIMTNVARCIRLTLCLTCRQPENFSNSSSFGIKLSSYKPATFSSNQPELIVRELLKSNKTYKELSRKRCLCCYYVTSRYKVFPQLLNIKRGSETDHWAENWDEGRHWQRVSEQMVDRRRPSSTMDRGVEYRLPNSSPDHERQH